MSISDDIKVFYKANRIFAIGFKCKHEKDCKGGSPDFTAAVEPFIARGAPYSHASFKAHRQKHNIPDPRRVPIKWNHLIDKDSPKIKELEHVSIEKVEQFFQDML